MAGNGSLRHSAIPPESILAFEIAPLSFNRHRQTDLTAVLTASQGCVSPWPLEFTEFKSLQSVFPTAPGDCDTPADTIYERAREEPSRLCELTFIEYVRTEG